MVVPRIANLCKMSSISIVFAPSANLKAARGDTICDSSVLLLHSSCHTHLPFSCPKNRSTHMRTDECQKLKVLRLFEALASEPKKGGMVCLDTLRDQIEHRP